MSLSQNEFLGAQAPQISICHIAQRHAGLFTDNTNLKEVESVSFSQFNILKTIIANPDAIVLDEGLTKNISSDEYTIIRGDQTFFTSDVIHQIKETFANIPDTFQQLTLTQKKQLRDYGGSLVAFSLKIINAVYKTDTEDDLKLMILHLSNQYFILKYFVSLILPKQIYNVTNDSNIMYLLTARREKAALNFGIQAAKESGKANPLVLIIYGGLHDFEKKFKEVIDDPQVRYLGRIMTFDTRSVGVGFPNLKEAVFPAGVPLLAENPYIILKERFKQIINLYGVKYKSTSIFGFGYQSSVMKSLAGFIDADNNEPIRFKDIYNVLVKADEHHAILFSTGQDPDEQISVTATRQIILELSNVFNPAKERPQTESEPSLSSYHSLLL